MNQTKKTARLAGLLYLLVGLTAPIGLIYVPSTLIVPGNATATASHIAASGSLLRIGIASELFHQTIFIFLVLALYRVLRSVNERRAVLMVILGALVSVPIVFVNVLNEIAALILVSGADFLSVFDKRQLDALAYLFLRLHGQGIAVATVFWGLWLFPFGMLVIRSGFIPSVLGVLLIVAGVGNLANALTALLLPDYVHLVGHVAMGLGFGELPIMLWLLVFGAREQAPGGPAGVSADELAAPARKSETRS
jgi:hypothetical protein